jgi:hypothetical protein
MLLDHVRMQVDRCINKFSAVVNHAHDLEFTLQEQRNRASHVILVVGNQHAQFPHEMEPL